MKRGWRMGWWVASGEKRTISHVAIYYFNVVRFLVSLADRFASYQNFLFVNVYSTSGWVSMLGKVFLFRRNGLGKYSDTTLLSRYLRTCLSFDRLVPLSVLDHFLFLFFSFFNLIENSKDSINIIILHIRVVVN